MAERIAKHEFVDGKCLYCENADPDAMCNFRDAPPRAIPTSCLEDHDFIRKRVAEIVKEEGWPEPDQAPVACIPLCELLPYVHDIEEQLKDEEHDLRW